MGRPEKPVDAKAVKALAKRGCKVSEIADELGVSHDTLQRRFAQELREGRAELKSHIRALQLKTAERGNPQMQIWLGKQYCDQKEKTEIEHEFPDPTIIHIPGGGQIVLGSKGSTDDEPSTDT